MKPEPDSVVRFIRVGDLRSLLAGQRIVYEEGQHEVLVLALDECVYAIGNVCTHEEVWLDDGTLHPESCEIECPMHEGRFDLRTGAATREPAEAPVPVYPIRIEDGEVFVGLP